MVVYDCLVCGLRCGLVLAWFYFGVAYCAGVVSLGCGFWYLLLVAWLGFAFGLDLLVYGVVLVLFG